jgi:hypothetical protein
MAELLNNGFAKPDDFLGHRYEDIELTQDMIDEKVRPAMRLLDQVDPEQMMDMYVEFKVGFGDVLPGVFGSCDVIGRLKDTAYIIDWKFGDGVAVSLQKKTNSLCSTRLRRCVPKGRRRCFLALKRSS